MSTFIDIAAAIIAVLTVVTYPILCLLLGYALGERKERKKNDSSEEVLE